MISIVTPWLNHSELCPIYERATRGAQMVVIDNGSQAAHAERIADMCQRNKGVYVRSDVNLGYSRANNLGLEAAQGDIVVFLNNDVEARGEWLHLVERDVKPGALYGPSMPPPKHGVEYIEGYCIAATAETWRSLNGWDADYYTGLYWEDNDICWRAMQAGCRLVQTGWPLWHFSNYTSSKLPGAYDHSAENERRFLARIAGRG